MAEILRAASVEMAEAAAWYDERVAGLGERFLSEGARDTGRSGSVRSR